MKLPLHLKICFGFTVVFVSIFLLPLIFEIIKEEPEYLAFPLVSVITKNELENYWSTLMIILGVHYLIISLIPTIIALEKNRSGFGFFLLSIFVNPIAAIITALIIKPDKTNYS